MKSLGKIGNESGLEIYRVDEFGEERSVLL